MRLIITLIILFTFSCTSNSFIKPIQLIDDEIKLSKIFKSSFVGLSIYDLDTHEFIYSHNADKYFTPASNTKLLTFFTSLQLLEDSIPGLLYKTRNDSLFFWGTADPTFLNPDTLQNRTFEFLKNRTEKLFFVPTNYAYNHYGVGWMWDDFNSSYQPELSSFPIYNNFVQFKLDSVRNFHISPSYFNYLTKMDTSLETSSIRIERDLKTNHFTYNYTDSTINRIRYRPFIYSDSLLIKLLGDTLGRKVGITYEEFPDSTKVLYSYPTDSLLKKMMQPSDNFFAESILLMSSFQVFKQMNTDSIIRYSRDSLLSYIMTDQPKWVDGSGLSRYNIFTPRSLVQLLNYFHQTYQESRLFDLLAIGGVNGTIKNRFIKIPYRVFGKTGTLSNNHSLTAYLVCKSGKKIIFSFMNNHYMLTNNEIRAEMDRLIIKLYNTY